MREAGSQRIDDRDIRYPLLVRPERERFPVPQP